MKKFLKIFTHATLLSVALSQGASAAEGHKNQTQAPASSIRMNQLGFLTLQPKIAIVPNVQDIRFTLVDNRTGEEVYSGPLREGRESELSGETVKIADFSDLQTRGEYVLKVESLQSDPFTIGKNLYKDALSSSIKAYYYNRIGAALEERHAGQYSRPASHPDTLVYIHPSAASTLRPVGTTISAPKGWFDAGDYNKYIVNSAITVHQLLQTYTDHSAYFNKLKLNIPESDNAIPDLLDEIKWNLDWMLDMQDPNDGGVYHKLTTKRFTPHGGLPHEHYKPRYVVAKSTAAALDFAATMAQASRVIAPHAKHLPGYTEKLEHAAKTAWVWAKKNPSVFYKQPKDIHTGTYSQSKKGSLKDEWLWAAAELFATTNDKKYIKKLKLPKEASLPGWRVVGTLGLLTLAESPNTPDKLKAQISVLLKARADDWVKQWRASAYAVPAEKRDFRWGSNSNLLNKAYTLLRINKSSPDTDYVNASRAVLDYVLGRNPLDLTFVTGFGRRSPLNVHHRVSDADGIDAPIPGLLAGGPNTGQQDKKDCANNGVKYTTKLPALSYVDALCSYASNEVAINWNAPLVYVLAALQE